MRFTSSTALRVSAALALCVLALSTGTARTIAAKLTSGIDLSSLDRTCKPCADFYQFANGGWIAKTKIPAAYPSYGSFNILAERNRDVLHSIVETAATAHAPAGSNEQKIGDFYASCMDTAAIDKAGATPLRPMFSAIDGITDGKTLASAEAQLDLDGFEGFFGFGSGADFKDSAQTIAQLGQGGLGLPDRDYYLKDDAKTKAIRDAYVAHVTKMLTLLGEAGTQAASDAQAVMAIETALAKASLTRVERRNPNATYHKMTLAQLQALAPNFDWATYFQTSGVTPASINVAEPNFFKAFSDLLPTLTNAQIKAYLTWHTLKTYASGLSQPFDDEQFAFYGKTLTGATEQLPRWKRCVRATDNNLGEALGALYVARAFPAPAKAQALELVKYLKQTLRDDISTLDWMSSGTRARAVDKLDAFMLKIGYPDKWRNYSALTIARGPYATNLIASSTFETRREYAKIDKPTDRSEWGMTPSTVNAYYNPTINEIVFPAGILQPPFFDQHADMAVNFGAIGAVIGHESTHGFDDEGRQFDRVGNLVDWWTPADAANFNKRAKCIVDQYNALSPLPGLHENGQLVQGEATADLGGLTIAYKAFERWQATHPRRTIDGFSPEQRFFLGWAHIWANVERPEYTQLITATDPHAYGKFRVNATLANMPQFAAAWHCPIGTAMVRPPKERCQIW